MYLTPIIRTSRAISACLICPDHPLKAVAISETISLVGPLLNPQYLSKIIATTMAIIYAPSYGYYYVKQLNKVRTIYNEAELITILLFILTILINKY